MEVIVAGDLSGLKARIALMLALGAGWETARIRSYFACPAPTRKPRRRDAVETDYGDERDR
jgi:hypothetical protein